ncbi:MAG TPA: ABC transporter permease [Acidimicrobiaceae bacterium]|nr:ABC transporter permease [Acidimicrobiaceae bacterium]
MHAATIDEELDGLDHLEDVSDARQASLGRRLWDALWPKMAAVGLVLGFWQFAVWREWKPRYLLASPGDVWARLVEDAGTAEMWEAIGTTMQRSLVGFAWALVIGASIGLVVTASRHVRSAIGSLVTGLQTMPSIAWFPLAILLLGLTESAINFVVVLGAAPSIANGVISGIDSSPPLLRRAGRSMGARRWALYRDFLVPAAMPSVVAGLKQGWAFAWRSLMAGELLVLIPGAQSIGSRLNFAREFSDSEGVLASMLVILVIGILMDSIVFSRLERRVLRRRGLGATAR